jgi:hypothetical protein
MKNLLYLFAASILFSSCGKPGNKNEFRNDFEQLADWGFSSPMLKKGDAHSGNYYCGLDSTTDYSITFQSAIKDLPKPDFKTLDISAWARAKDISSMAALVIAIDTIGGNVKYMGIPLSDFILEADKWTEIQGTFTAPENLQPGFQLKIYLYNQGKESVDIDDIKFELK